MGARGVPVVMYHSVGPEKPGWAWNHLVMPAAVFERQMRALRDHGWTAISLTDLRAHISSGAPLPEKPVVLTFDDGYLDNYVFAWPIMKRYGHRAVIWVSTDFVDPSERLRPTLDDVLAGRAREEDLPVTGFLSWAEMREMTASGTIEIQSHAVTHTWYPCGPEIVDFHRPRGVDGYEPHPWLGWNRFPARKYAYMTERPEDEVPPGTPVYRHGKSLAVRRWLEDGSLADLLVGHVARAGGAAYFERPGWRAELERVAAGHAGGGRMETGEEYRARVLAELVDSKRTIEGALGVPVDFLCWPGGGRNPEALRLAAEAGYLATTTHYRDPSRRNLHGQDPREINRTGCGSPWAWRGVTLRDTSAGFFLAILDEFNGVPGARWRMRMHKGLFLLRALLSGERSGGGNGGRDERR